MWLLVKIASIVPFPVMSNLVPGDFHTISMVGDQIPNLPLLILLGS